MECSIHSKSTNASLVKWYNSSLVMRDSEFDSPPKLQSDLAQVVEQWFEEPRVVSATLTIRTKVQYLVKETKQTVNLLSTVTR